LAGLPGYYITNPSREAVILSADLISSSGFVDLKPEPFFYQQTQLCGWCCLKHPGSVSPSPDVGTFQCLALITELPTLGCSLASSGMTGISFLNPASLWRVGLRSLIHLYKGGFPGFPVTRKQFFIFSCSSNFCSFCFVIVFLHAYERTSNLKKKTVDNEIMPMIQMEEDFPSNHP
jgi:hypothetical protein